MQGTLRTTKQLENEISWNGMYCTTTPRLEPWRRHRADARHMTNSPHPKNSLACGGSPYFLNRVEAGAATSPRPLRDDPRLGWEAKRLDYLPHFRSLNGGV